MVKPRLEVKIGSAVMASDGEYGRLQQVILDPHQERVVALLIRQNGWGKFRIVVVPEEEVDDANDNEVRLKLSREQLNALPEYKPGTGLVVEGRKYEVNDESFAVRGIQGFEVGRTPTEQRPGMLENQIAQPERERLALQLRAGHKVFCQDGQAGSVSLMLLDPRGEVKGFVMHTGHLPGHDLIVPAAWVREVDRENVHLSVEKSALESLPDYDPDYVLEAEVDKALWADELLRQTDYKAISETVENGIVVLRGHVVTSANRSRAEGAAHSVAGVLDVENHLVVDHDLVITVAQALGSDQRTCGERVSVGAQNGVITLTGNVATAAIREAAEEIAATPAHVRGVVNDLRAPGVVIDPEDQLVLQPSIGRDVYATDVQLGQVERVIINPHNRRVTAFIAHGFFPDLQHEYKHRLPYEITQQERRVVIPIRAVRYETDSSVFLHINSIEAARDRDFDPADLAMPPEDWHPPYPYHRNEVLFERKSK